MEKINQKKGKKTASQLDDDQTYMDHELAPSALGKL